MIKNPTDFFVQATKLPATIEGVLPAGAPKVSKFLVDVANRLPTLPDFPISLPDLPDIPTSFGGQQLVTQRYVAAAAVTPVAVARVPSFNPKTEKVALVFE